ncbi:MAG TPA: cation:proton antiporter [Gaiellaceae bacterium]|nr:cation:proton antiporter [Gaiellaceae bacterium]
MAASLDPVSIPLGSSLGLAFLFLGCVLFAGIAALSHSHERAYSAAMIYLVLGVGAGLVVHHLGVGRLASPRRDPEVLEFVTDGALVLALFSTGMRIRRKPTVDGWHLSLRLILVALPAMVALVAVWGRGLMGLGLGAAIALGAALAPTDPVLAGDLGVDPPHEEEKEDEPEPEFVLTTEAGMNDGAGLPFLLLGVAVARGDSLWAWAGTHLVYSVVVGAVVGAATGRLLAFAASWLREREFLSADFDRWVGLAAAFAVYGLAEAIGSLGFVAAFAGGVAFRRHELDGQYLRDVHDGASVLKHFAELTVILLLGSMLALGGFGAAGAWGIALAPVAVFVIRPATAFLTLLGTSRLTMRERLWVAWFGVKGVASLNYAALVAAAAAFTSHDAGAVVWAVLTTVTLSVLVHGLTSTPLTRRLLGAER